MRSLIQASGHKSLGPLGRALKLGANIKNFKSKKSKIRKLREDAKDN